MELESQGVGTGSLAFDSVPILSSYVTLGKLFELSKLWEYKDTISLPLQFLRELNEVMAHQVHSRVPGPE